MVVAEQDVDRLQLAAPRGCARSGSRTCSCSSSSRSRGGPRPSPPGPARGLRSIPSAACAISLPIRIAVAVFQRALGSIRSRASGPSRSDIAIRVSRFDLGGQHAALELEDAEAPAVAEPRGHRGHRLGRADLAPGVEGPVAAAARVDQVRIGQDHRMIGGVAVEQIRGELDRVAHRAADQLAEAAAGRAAAGVEAGQLDPRVARPCPALATPGRTCGRRRRSGRPRSSRACSSAVVTLSPPWVSPMPTIPPSVCNSTTLRRKYGPWQPLAASSGGSGSAIGVTFKPGDRQRRPRRRCRPAREPVPPSRSSSGSAPSDAPAAMRSQSRRCDSSDRSVCSEAGWRATVNRLDDRLEPARWFTPAAWPDRCRAWRLVS